MFKPPDTRCGDFIDGMKEVDLINLSGPLACDAEDRFVASYGEPISRAAELNQALFCDQTLQRLQAPIAQAAGMAVSACTSTEQWLTGGDAITRDPAVSDGITAGTLFGSYIMTNTLPSDSPLRPAPEPAATKDVYLQLIGKNWNYYQLAKRHYTNARQSGESIQVTVDDATVLADEPAQELAAVTRQVFLETGAKFLDLVPALKHRVVEQALLDNSEPTGRLQRYFECGAGIVATAYGMEQLRQDMSMTNRQIFAQPVRGARKV
jgi:hypothetical protein